MGQQSLDPVGHSRVWVSFRTRSASLKIGAPGDPVRRAYQLGLVLLLVLPGALGAHAICQTRLPSVLHTYYTERVDEPTYRGVPLGDLEINAVAWPDPEHITKRAERKGQPGEMDVEEEWATEAALDPHRLVRLPSRLPSRSLIVVGWSSGAEAVLRVFLIPQDLAEGVWIGTTAAKASDRVARRYWKEREG